jgi:ATP-dependent RNA helicase DDX23/PRP28
MRRAFSLLSTLSLSSLFSPPISHAQPLPLDDLLARRAAAASTTVAAPVFLTKAQREAAALARRAEAVGGGPSAPQPSQPPRPSFATAAAPLATAAAPPVDRAPVLVRATVTPSDDGRRPKKPPAPRPGGPGAQRFQFEWDASDDTTAGTAGAADPLGLGLAVPAGGPLFGRGSRGGVDDLADRRRRTAAAAPAPTKREEDQDRRLGPPRGATKNDHWTAKPRDAMTERDWRIFLEDHSISYKGPIGGGAGGAGRPLRAWEEATTLSAPVRRGIDACGYAKPSPIQMAAIPLGLLQRDVIGLAETGSGKTAAFVVPMLAYLETQPAMDSEAVASDGPYAVVLAPTRELAQQIEGEAVKLARFTPYRFVTVVGGASIEDQAFALRKGCEVVVATPGRLVDCLDRALAVLNQCAYVVLDEADRMVDLGFEAALTRVLDAMPVTNMKPEDEDEEDASACAAVVAGALGASAGAAPAPPRYRTTYMFSATMPPAVERLARSYLRRPVVVTVGSAGRATDNVAQRVLMVADEAKPAALLAEVGRALGASGRAAAANAAAGVTDTARVIVFVNTRAASDRVSHALGNAGVKCATLHGGRSQDAREASLASFRDGSLPVLVATDVAGRGLDVRGVTLVVNYDMAGTVDAYTHRIGRTGRAGRKGEALTFLTSKDTDVYFDLRKLLEASGAPVPPGLASHEASRVKPGGDKRRGGGGGGGEIMF